jgi:catechol 2,3-dioxygenase
MELSLKFYAEALGLDLLDQTESTSRLGTVGQEPLVVLTEEPGARSKPPQTVGLYHYALLLPTRKDLGRFFLYIRDLDYPLVGAADHLVSEAIYLQDPDGHGIEIYADRPKKNWPRENGALKMATHALDVEDLISSLNDKEEWQGIPPATRLGHIHLHVAHLEPAIEFYKVVLGFDLVLHYGPQAAFLSVGGYHHHIGLNTWAGIGAPQPPQDAAVLRFVTLVLPRQKDVDRLQSRLAAHQAPIRQNPEGTLTEDPSGNAILIRAV